MKTHFLIAFLALTCNCYSQTILKFKFDQFKPDNHLYTSDSIKKIAAEVNSSLDKLKNNTALKDSSLRSIVAMSTQNLLLPLTRDTGIIRLKLDSLEKIKTDSNAPIPSPIDIKDFMEVAKRKQGCSILNNIAIIKFQLTSNNNTNTYTGVLQNSHGNALESFDIIQLDKELFYNKLSEALSRLCPETSIVTGIVSSLKTDPDLYTKFLEAKNGFTSLDDLAGILTIKKNTYISIDTTTGREKTIKAMEKISRKRGLPTPTISTDNKRSFSIFDIQIQFQDGFIENIKISGKKTDNDTLLYFENIGPIAFSTKKDFQRFQSLFLLSYRSSRKDTLKLSDFLSYDQNLENDNKDYSPANQVLTIKSLADTEKEVALYKEQTTQLLEVKVFSDLKGTDSNNPNGLIQLELCKRLNLLSRRQRTIWDGNSGWLNYVSPRFTWSKIEDNQKRLVLNHIDTLSLAIDTSKAVTYTSTINLLRHQIYSIGFDLTVYTRDIPAIKSTFYIGASAYWGRSALQDTLRDRDNATTPFTFHASSANNVKQYGVNTFQWGPFITWQMFPNSRFGLTATQRFTWFKALSADFVQVRDSAHYLSFISNINRNDIRSHPYNYYNYEKSDNWLGKNIIAPLSMFTKCIATSEIFLFFNFDKSTNNKLFFRYKMNWDLLNAKENFQQMQVGFSTNFTATKEYDNLKNASNLF